MPKSPTEPLKIPYQVASLDEVPAPLKLFYKPSEGGRFDLSLDDHPDSARLSEFRENNRALNAQKAELEAKLKALEGQAAGAGEHSKKADELAAALEQERTAHQRTRFAVALAATARAAGHRDEAADYLVQKALAAGFTLAPDGTVAPANGADITAWLADPALAWTRHPSRGVGAHTTLTGPSTDTRPVVNAGDAENFGKHLEGIAKGDVRIV